MKINWLLGSLFVGFVGLSGCTDNNKKEEKSEEKSADAGVDLVKDLPTYPTSKLEEELTWLTNDEDPVFASPEAKRGGTFYDYIDAFPLSLRNTGPDSNGSFRAYIDGNMMNIIGFHPNTYKPFPALATHWAFGKDNKTVYFKLDPRARWSDGKKIVADDYLFTNEMYRSKYIVAPFTNNYMEEKIESVKKYDDYTISVTGKVALPELERINTYSLGPRPRHFHKLDENWVRDYNWKTEPNTGAYQISEVKKGQKVVFTRKKDWWGDNLKYYKNRFNPDKVVITVIRDPNVAWEHFKKGNLSNFELMNLPEYWYTKSDSKEFHNGYIHKLWSYVDKPQANWGIWLNTDDPLFKDLNVRLAFAHALNIERVNKEVLRGDYIRQLNQSPGYGKYENKEIPEREYNIEKVKKYMEASGWKRGSDGIWMKGDQKFSVTLTYGRPPHTERVVVLKEEAKKAGVEINLQLLDGSAAFKSFMDKKHQVAYSAWASGFIPHYWGQYHSDNAHKVNTTNISNTDDKQLDELIKKFDSATQQEERYDLSKKIQYRIYETGGFIPTFMSPWVRTAYWGWWKFPTPPGTRGSDALMRWYESGYGGISFGGLFWLDKDEEQKINQAKNDGKKLPEVTIIDKTYKTF